MEEQKNNVNTAKKTKRSASPGNQRALRWCYTLNNPVHPIEFNELTMAYLVYGKETGESGTFHHQGFIVFKNRKTMQSLKELNNKAHWESAKGTNRQASDYCKKDGAFEEFGDMPEDPHVKGGAAQKDKWRSIVDCAKAGDLESIDRDHPKQLVTSYRTLKQIKVDYMKRIEDLPKVCGIWYHGLSDAGKSFRARKAFPDAYFKACNKWWDGYQGEENVIVDDFDPNHKVLGHHLKIWADRYSFLGETKGGTVLIRPKNIVITSQYPIKSIFEDDETRSALERRFVQVECKRSDWDNPLTRAFQKHSERYAAEKNLGKKRQRSEEDQTNVVDLPKDGDFVEGDDNVIGDDVGIIPQYVITDQLRAEALLECTEVLSPEKGAPKEALPKHYIDRSHPDYGVGVQKMAAMKPTALRPPNPYARTESIVDIWSKQPAIKAAVDKPRAPVEQRLKEQQMWRKFDDENPDGLPINRARPVIRSFPPPIIIDEVEEDANMLDDIDRIVNENAKRGYVSVNGHRPSIRASIEAHGNEILTKELHATETAEIRKVQLPQRLVPAATVVNVPTSLVKIIREQPIIIEDQAEPEEEEYLSDDEAPGPCNKIRAIARSAKD